MSEVPLKGWKVIAIAVIKNCLPLGPYSGTMPRALQWS